MEGELDSSMSDYDGMIIAEREYIQNRENQKGREEEVAQVDRGAIFDEADIVTGEVKQGSPDQSAGGPRNQTSGVDDGDYGMVATARQGDFKGGGKASFPPPADIPSGHDDDVVARQIREAAMNEPDAALREKLWEEYRKYKNQSAEE